MKKFIGYTILASMPIGLFVSIAWESGLVAAAFTFLFSIIGTCIFLFALYVIENETTK